MFLYYNIIVGKDTFAVSIFFQEEKNMRKFLALMLSVLMTASAVSAVANAAKFTDVPASDETLTKAVELLASVGITTGTTETTFGTSEKVTRQQMAAFVYRLMKAGRTAESGVNTTSFTDLVDPFYNFVISWADDAGVIKGTSQTTFNPTGEIILQDAYTMLVRALGYEEFELFDYPFGYIEMAEKIGLDEGLPASVNYTTPLTRGNIAVLLYNAFYGNLAKGYTTYESQVDEVLIPGTEENPQYKLVEVGKIPVVTYYTVAEKIFGIEKTVQRVVATPNYSLSDPYTKNTYEKTDDDLDDEAMVSLACYDLDYKDTDAGLFGDVLFSDLGLEGEADDYFLIDLSIYYKKEDNGDKTILAANALGTRKNNIPKSNAKFERDDNRYIGRAPSSTDLYYVDTSQARYKAYTGKITIDGVDSYLFNAPWSYLKPKNIEDKDDANITLLFLGATDRDPESEDFVQDYNFVAHTDAVGRGSKEYAAIDTTYVYNKDGALVETYIPREVDERGGGLYSSYGIYHSMYTCINVNDYQVDVWDSNGDGKIDYMWTKPYTIARISNDAGEPFHEMHKGGEDPTNLDVQNILDRFGPVQYVADEIATIYSYGATVEDDIELTDGKLFTGYINGPANVICPSIVSDFKYETFMFNRFSGDTNSIYLDGKNYYIYHSARSYIGFPGANGERDGDFSLAVGSLAKDTGAAYKKYFGAANVGKSYMVVLAGNLPFHVKRSGDVIVGGEDYAIIFPNSNENYAYTTSVGVVTDGNLKKTGNYIDVMIGNEIKSVPVKPQLDKDTADNNIFVNTAGEEVCLRPLTPEEANETYNFNEYVGKLLKYTVNKNGEYVFEIAPLELNVDKTVLKGDDGEAFYTYQADEDGINTAAFVKTGDGLYQFVNAGYGTLQQTIAPSKYVRVSEATKIVIKTVEDEKDVFTIYDSENLPDFSDSVDLKKIKYVVKNNPKSTTIEDLIYLYGEATGNVSSGTFGNIYDYRIVREYKTVKTEDGKIVYYDVYNPFTGKVEDEYETVTESETAVASVGGIYALTTKGYIADENQFGRIDELGKVATSDVTADETGLGLVEITGYDEENGLLEVEGEQLLFQIDDDTVVTFLDLDKETIKKVDTSVLGSNSKIYRCNDNGDMPLLAFIASSEIKKEDDIELAELIVIVRYNSLDNTEEA